MNRNTKVLARAAAVDLPRTAACAGEGRLWSAQEQQHASATTQEEAREAAAPLLEFCHRCPLISACDRWAATDEYDGIAAGRAWAGGKSTPAHWVPGHPPKQALAA